MLMGFTRKTCFKLRDNRIRCKLYKLKELLESYTRATACEESRLQGQQVNNGYNISRVLSIYQTSVDTVKFKEMMSFSS
jgi:hypothetical protein